MTKYREIIRLASLSLSQTNIALSCGVSKKTVNKVLKAAREKGISWPLDPNQTDSVIEQLLFPKKNSPESQSNRRMPDYAHIRKELLRNGVNKKLLWTEYLEECRLSGDDRLCTHSSAITSRRMNRSAAPPCISTANLRNRLKVDWAGDPAHIIDPDTGEILDAHIFVGVMTYSQYPYVEAFMDEKQPSWIAAHVHMYEYFGGVAGFSCRITAVLLWITTRLERSADQCRLSGDGRALWHCDYSSPRPGSKGQTQCRGQCRQYLHLDHSSPAQ